MAFKRMAAEMVGTFVLVFGGVGAAVIAGPKIGNVGVARCCSPTAMRSIRVPPPWPPRAE
jgi:hypothetical protein